MSDKQDFGEPWKATSIMPYPFEGMDGKTISQHDPDVVRRIVACVNACQDIPTEDLENTRDYVVMLTEIYPDPEKNE